MNKVVMMKILAVTLVLLLGARPAAACWCGDVTRQELYDNSSAVFSGVVASVEFGSLVEPTRYELTVTACWKGVSELGSVVTVWSDGWSSCSFGAAALGEEWVIYASGPTDGLFTDQCDPNEQVPLAPGHAAFLGPSSCGPVPIENETWGKIKTTYR